MRSLRFSLSLCAVAVSAVLGCDDGAEQGATNESTATSCAVEAFDSTWWNQAFPEQTGMFHVEFSADVTASYMDTVIALSNGPATKWASLAAIVRFNPQGFIDARDGSTYRADASVAYQPNTRYWFRFDVDVRTHRYSVWFKTVEYSWIPYQPLAQNYAFRTEQASVARLNNVAVEVADAMQLNEQSSYDVIAVTGSLPIYDERFQQALRIGGRLFVVVGQAPIMEAWRVLRVGEREWQRQALFETVLEPLVNAPRPSAFVF